MASDLTFSGFSGIDTTGMVDALLAIEQQKVTRVQAQRVGQISKQTAWSTLSSSFSALGTSAAGIASSSRLASNSVASSNPDAVSVSGSADIGSVSFAVGRLATSSLVSVSGLPSPSATVGTGNLTISTGLSGLGVDAAAATVPGSYEVAVLDAGSSASVGAGFGSSVTLVVSTNLTLTASSPSGSTATTVSVPSGTYTHESLATTLNGLLAGSGMTAAVVDGVATVFANSGVGSSMSIAASGVGAARLSMGSGTGTDARVSVDGAETAVTSLEAGGSLTVSAGSGELTLTLQPGQSLAVGSASLTTIGFDASATVSDVVSAVNDASLGSSVTAGVIGGTGSTQILLTGVDTGAANSVHVDWSGFLAGEVSELRAATDAEISFGSQTITRASNVLSDLIPGATVSLLATTDGEEVTITSALDQASMISKITGFVTAVNDTLSTIDTLTRTVVGSPGQSGALSGDPTARFLRRSLVSSLTAQQAAGTYSSLASVGVMMGRDGRLTVDQSALSDAIAADPDAVARVFSQSVEASSSSVDLLAASSRTVPGSYSIEVTQAAQRAEAVSAAFATTSTAEVLNFTVGDDSVSVTVEAGQSINAVIDLINSSFANSGVRASAQLTASSEILLATDEYGSAASLQVTSSGTSLGWSSITTTGVDVAGLVDGVAGNGVGQVLYAQSDDTSGLALRIGSSAAEVSAAGGSLTSTIQYGSGTAGILRTMVEQARDADGSIGVASQSATAALARIDAEIERATRLFELTESRLRKQFAALETALARIKSATPNFAALVLPSEQQ